VVRAAFALDTCDREVMAWRASTRGVTGKVIRDLMLESVEQRFGPLLRHIRFSGLGQRQLLSGA
jgi:transposase InsO family protein